MAKTYLDYDGLLYFWQKIKAVFSTKAETVKSISRSGTTFTATRADGTTFTFTQQDNTVAKTTSTPLMDGTAAIGNENKYAAGNHVHPTDTSRAPLASPGLTGTPTAPTASAGTNTTQIATTAFVQTALSNSGYEANQNAFSNVKVGSTTIAADSKTDTLELVAGSNVTLTPDATNDKVTIKATDTTYSDVTTSTHGLMTAADKVKLNKLVFDSSNLIDSSILPSYVDDVVEAYPRSGQTELSSGWLSLTSGGAAFTPEAGKIYVLMANSTNYTANSQFRWGGSTYVKLNDGGMTPITNAEIDTIVAS